MTADIFVVKVIGDFGKVLIDQSWEKFNQRDSNGKRVIRNTNLEQLFKAVLL